MSRAIVAAFTVVLLAVGAHTAAADDSSSPHHGTTTCPVCHNEDMTLQRSKLETCTLCHGETPHSGAAEHARLDAARVKRALGDRPSHGAVTLPLTDDGRIWCGTCHLFHDPSLGETWLPMSWLPPGVGLPQAVRDGVKTRWEAIAAAHGQSKVDASFAGTGTRQLRLPVENGALCKECHGSTP